MSFGKKKETQYGLDLKRPVNYIPKGPYKTKAERWNALDRILDFQSLRERSNLPRVLNTALEKITGIPWDEMDREMNSQAFQEMRIARATMKIQSSLVETAPAVKKLLLDIQGAIQGDKHLCEVCSKELKVIPLTPKEKDAMLGTIQTMMTKVGFDKVDLSAGDVMNDVNTDEALKEASKIVEELTGVEPIIQRLIVASTDPGTLRKNKGQALAPRLDTTTPENNQADGPVSTVQTLSVHVPVADESKEILMRNNLQSPEQDKLDML